MGNKAQVHEKLPIDILFVEDEETMRTSIAEIMQRRVNSVYIADNGEKGLNLYIQHRPKVVLTDIRMPVMSGLEMVEEIKKYDENIKVIVISAHSDVEYFQQAINLGVDGFLLKPIDISLVIKQVLKVTRQLVYQQKAMEFENKLHSINEMIFQNKTRAANMQASMAPPWIIPEKKILFASNYIVDETKPSGDFFDIIPISETRYITYLGHFPFHDIRGTLFILTIKMTLDTIIKNEFEHASPGIILERLVSIMSDKDFIENIEIMICLIDSDFEYVRFAKMGSADILQYDLQHRNFIDINQHAVEVKDEDDRKKIFPEREFSFSDHILSFLFSRNIKEYQRNGESLGLEGIKSIIKDIDSEKSFLIPYLFRQNLIDMGFSLETTDFSFLLFKNNELIKKLDNRYLVNFKSILTNTAHIRRECEQFVLQKTNLDDLAFSIELVIAEMLTNVIVHGLKNKPDTMVVLSLEISQQVIISIWDKGIKWELPELDKTDAFSQVENDATSGRGMPIIITLSDKIERKRIDKINQTKIYFNIEPEKENLC